MFDTQLPVCTRLCLTIFFLFGRRKYTWRKLNFLIFLKPPLNTFPLYFPLQHVRITQWGNPNISGLNSRTAKLKKLMFTFYLKSRMWKEGHRPEPVVYDHRCLCVPMCVCEWLCSCETLSRVFPELCGARIPVILSRISNMKNEWMNEMWFAGFDSAAEEILASLAPISCIVL